MLHHILGDKVRRFAKHGFWAFDTELADVWSTVLMLASDNLGQVRVRPHDWIAACA